MVAHGIGAAKRYHKKQKAKKTAAKDSVEKNSNSTVGVIIPAVTEDDLLAFQHFHFGDDTKPNMWFVDAETALNYDAQVDDDGLGYYEDGVKRTLTDEQIEMFRHSEMVIISREEKIRAELDERDDGRKDSTANENRKMERAVSPVSDISSIEDELFGVGQSKSVEPPLSPIQRERSQSCRSGTSYPTNSKTRRRAYETPYEQRHKRKWEDYIEENDPFEGSLTHRRIVRELDTHYDESVDLDY